jgi:hypothetical protein
MPHRRPSPAMAVASLALFVSLGSSSYAAVQLSKNSVRSTHIKDGEVKRADLARNVVGTGQVADGSLLAADFKAGQVPAGPRGATGPQGPKGVANFVVRANAGTDGVTAKCQPGEIATGGGAHSFSGVIDGSAPVSDPLALFTTGMPSSLGYTPTAWSAHAVNDDGYGSADVTVWVVCATP